MRNLNRREGARATAIILNVDTAGHLNKCKQQIFKNLKSKFSTQANVASESVTKASAVSCPFHFDKLVVEDDHSKQLIYEAERSRQNASAAITKSKYMPFNSIPGPSPSLPLIGTNWTYLPFIGHYNTNRLLDMNVNKFRRYGPIMKEEFGYGKPMLTIFDPSDIKQVFKSEESCPARPTLDYIVKHRRSDSKRYSNIGLANMMGKEWQELRSKIAPFLLSRELKNRTIVSQHRISTRLVEHIRKKTDNNLCEEGSSQIINNIQDVFSRYSMESIMNLCISHEISCFGGRSSLGPDELDGELILEAAMNFFVAQHKLYYGHKLINYLDNRPYKQLCESQNTIHDIASKYIDRALKEINTRVSPAAYKQDNDDVQEDSIGSLSESSIIKEETVLESLYKSGKFSDLDIKGTIVDFVTGGIYTLTNTLTMALFLLASNQIVQDKLYNEIRQVFDNDYDNYEKNKTNSDIYIDLNKLEHLKYLKLCMKESYRMLPTIPGIARILQKDLVLSNFHVPKNTLVFCNSMTTCRLPEYFDDPDSFNPSRWDRNDKDYIYNRNPDLAFAILPFGHGVRKCVGHSFAELQTYIALTKLIRNFKIETIDGEDAHNIELDFNFIVVPRKPVRLRFTPRNTN